ncbi:hypothetical protein GCM10018793_28540 [Streptomyces sulfonofaciens]|uniref:Uncharacterized protein n=1 Tax=Streptomyces sulfonofaciens TaxID=68272 RepID=A0A919KZG8_9ACTN|nr:hypothetical protein GCM10018793_28540 [Streptomyces sulfonofaciens]
MWRSGEGLTTARPVRRTTHRAARRDRPGEWPVHGGCRAVAPGLRARPPVTVPAAARAARSEPAPTAASPGRRRSVQHRQRAYRADSASTGSGAEADTEAGGHGGGADTGSYTATPPSASSTLRPPPRGSPSEAGAWHLR